MVDIFYLSNDKHVDINVIDSVENIAGMHPDFYEKFRFRFYTLDFNAPEPFISDPWMLFAVYNDTTNTNCWKRPCRDARKACEWKEKTI